MKFQAAIQGDSQLAKMNFVGRFLDARRTKWFIPEGPVFMGEYSVLENRYHLKMLRK